MTQPNDIALILEQSHDQGWPFSQQFEALKKIGVTSYEVVPSTYDAVFYGTFGIWRPHQAPDDMPDTPVGAEFNREAFLEALDRRTEKEITYIQFLQQIAHAGVDRYVVDMAKRTVTYYGIDEEQFYVQDVP